MTASEDGSQDGGDIAPPLFAPLPIPFLVHLSECLAQPLALAVQRVQGSRLLVYNYMQPIVGAEQLHRTNRQAVRSQGNNIDTGWLIASLSRSSPGKRRIPLPTLSDWHTRHLLRYRAWGYPDFQSAAALLLMRMLCPQPRGWLPSTMSEQEPQWWCWRQDAPDQLVRLCPYPLPHDLPDAALLWTPWSGASWDGDWIPIGSHGAIRWGTVTPGASKCWRISLQDLSRWDADVTTLHVPFPPSGYGGKEMERQFVHVLATVALYRLAQRRLLEGMFVGEACSHHPERK